MSGAAARLAVHRPRLGVVLGSGLGAVAERVEVAEAIGFEELEGFPPAGVVGHAGRAVLGTLGDLPVCVLQGRAHAYQFAPGNLPGPITSPVRALAEAGCEAVLLTNAAGSLRPEVGPGSLMAITDHINLMGFNPLVGPHFVPMGDAYDAGLLELLGAPHRGVYLAVRGPSFETPAEIRAFRTLGADAVGMSTVPEVIVARHLGLRVAAVSVITNLAEGLAAESPSHAQTLRDAQRAAADLAALTEGFCAALA